jgi:hypothetical protein
MSHTGSDITGDWFGIFVTQPHRGIIHVTFQGNDGAIHGTWDFPRLERGAGIIGKFTATRFGQWIRVRIKSPRLLANVECQLTIVEVRGETTITGVIPLETFAVPFGTVTLFRGEPAKIEMMGVCPLRGRGVRR